MNGFHPSNRPAPRSGRITRAPSPAMAYLTPWATIVLASALSCWPIIAGSPLMPPLGFLVLLSWRQLHPGLLPVWAGLPLGFVDDLMSGQPMGSGMMTWSLAMLAVDLIEYRWPWRHFAVEWAVAAGMIVAYIIATALIANASVGPIGNPGVASLLLLLPQLALSVLLYPVIARGVARLDSFRLVRYRVFG